MAIERNGKKRKSDTKATFNTEYYGFEKFSKPQPEKLNFTSRRNKIDLVLFRINQGPGNKLSRGRGGQNNSVRGFHWVFYRRFVLYTFFSKAFIHLMKTEFVSRLERGIGHFQIALKPRYDSEASCIVLLVKLVFFHIQTKLMFK